VAFEVNDVGKIKLSKEKFLCNVGIKLMVFRHKFLRIS